MSIAGQSPARLAVFDLDGTLVDSQRSIVASMSAAFAEAGLAVPSDAAVRSIIGLELVEACATLLPEGASADPRDIAEGYKTAYRRWLLDPEARDPLFPGAMELLHRLDAAGWLLAIATGKGRDGLKATLSRHGIESLFLSTRTAHDGPGKPDPTILRSLMAELGTEPAATVMIGDTVFDMGMAKRAGVDGIGVAWGYHEIEELLLAGAGTIAEDMPGLGALLEARR